MPLNAQLHEHCIPCLTFFLICSVMDSFLFCFPFISIQILSISFQIVTVRFPVVLLAIFLDGIKYKPLMFMNICVLYFNARTREI